MRWSYFRLFLRLYFQHHLMVARTAWIVSKEMVKVALDIWSIFLQISISIVVLLGALYLMLRMLGIPITGGMFG